MIGIASWFASLGRRSKVGIGVAILCIAIVMMGTGYHLVNMAFGHAEDKGAAIERSTTQEKVIDNAIKAKAAADTVRRDGVPLADCVRDSRAPENC